MGLIMKNGVDYSGAANAEEISVQLDGSNVILQDVIDDLLGGMAAKESDVAINNHDIGDYILIGSKLYKVTAAITAGDVITVGTNVALTNVGEIVKNSAVLSNGTEIPENADLDTYTTPGVYYSPTAARSATLSNSPTTTSGFKLLVMHAGYSYDVNFKTQILINGASAIAMIWMRTGLNGAWQSWNCLTRGDLNSMFMVPSSYEDLRTKARKISGNAPATIYLAADLLSIISDNGFTGITFRGILCRSAGDVFDFVGTTGAGQTFTHLRVLLGENAPTVQSLRKQPISADPLFKVVAYTYAYSLAANENINITANQFEMSTPSGYTPIAVRNFYSGSNNAAVRAVYGSATGGSTVMSVRNFTTNAISNVTAGLTVLYVRSDSV